MNNNVFTGELTSEIEVYGLPGRERVEAWVIEPLFPRDGQRKRWEE